MTYLLCLQDVPHSESCCGPHPYVARCTLDDGHLGEHKHNFKAGFCPRWNFEEPWTPSCMDCDACSGV